MQSSHYHTHRVALAGYQEVNSLSGRLYYLPDNIHHALNLEEFPIPPVFQTRTVRPHRIHISRVQGEVQRRIGKSPPKTRRTVSIIFGKLAGPKKSAKRFFKYVIRTSTAETLPESLNSASPTLPTPVPTPTQTARPRLERTRPSIRRPFSWAPGTSESSRMRPSILSRRESKRRSATAIMGSPLRNTVGGSIGNGVLSPLAMSDEASRSLQAIDSISNASQKIPDEKPVASGNGVNVSIALAEPCLFLQGFEQGDLAANRSTAMLRGSLVLKITKATKIKSVSLKFKGIAMTKWPEGIPPKKMDFEEVNNIMSHTWPFFNAQFATAENSTGADHIELAQKFPTDNASKRASLDMRDLLRKSNTSMSNIAKADRRMSLQVTPIGPGRDASPGPGNVAQKGYKVFQPGDYVYNFELPLDSHLPETIDVELGSVKYDLEATIERAGAFRGNLVGTKEVVLIRTPAEGSLEQVEPIAIARTWDDQLHYDIVISGKSFPLGSQIPIAFKLTPLAKVQCHRIKVFLTESVEYFCSNRRVHRTEPARKILLFEKRADSPPASTYQGSSMRIVSGGGVPYDMREAAARGDTVRGTDPNNLLGNLERGDGTIGATELEMNVQLPTCKSMGKDKNARLHFDTTYHNIQVHHWIKIVLRLSRPDASDPSKRRHFEISIDSPFHILSCQATQHNIFLPAYTSPNQPNTSDPRQYQCGCPGSPVRRNSPPTYVPTLSTFGAQSPTDSARNSSDVAGVSIQPPPTAHVSGDASPPSNSSSANVAPRPMHIIRVPSYNPPAFDAEVPPPPLETPPPQYDSIASPTTGLADYFARLSDAYSSTDTETVEDDEGDGMDTPTQRRSLIVEEPPQPPVAPANAVSAWI